MHKTEKTCKKGFFNFFFYGKPQVGFNRNQFWILGTCRITTVKSVFVLFKIKPKHRLARVCRAHQISGKEIFWKKYRSFTRQIRGADGLDMLND